MALVVTLLVALAETGLRVLAPELDRRAAVEAEEVPGLGLLSLSPILRLAV